MKHDVKPHPNTIAPAAQPARRTPAVTRPIGVPARSTMQLVTLSEATVGWLPALSVVVAAGLVLVALAFLSSRAGQHWGDPLFWLGILTFTLPVGLRLISPDASREERMGLLVLAGLAFYFVKVLHSPVAFTFSDEPVHYYNVDQVLQSGRLFQPNFVLEATPMYPGLPAVAAAIASLSGMSIFSTGLLIVGVARIVLVLSLFLFYERISGSARVAGVAGLLYMANPNFTFYSSQYAYESLALPMATLCLAAIARRSRVRPGAERAGLTAVVFLMLLAVVLTHHMTSYAIAAILVAWSSVSFLTKKLRPHLAGPYAWLVRWGERQLARARRWRARVGRLLPWRPADGVIEPSFGGPGAGQADLGLLPLIAPVATLTWLVYGAGLTFSYLGGVYLRMMRAVIELSAGAAREGTSRQLFQSSSGYVAPLWERAAGIGAVLLILIGLPFGLYVIWRHYRRDALAMTLGGAALAYFGMLALRFLPSGWEIANRSSEFLFVGIGFVLALGIVELWMRYRLGWVGRVLFTGFLGVLVLGGVIVGWSPNGRFARPYLVGAGERTIEPQGATAGRWSLDLLGPHHVFATDFSNARFLMAYGRQNPYSSSRYGVKDMMYSGRVGWAETGILQTIQAEYVLVDRRTIAWDPLVGSYFNRQGIGDEQQEELFDPEVYQKFDGLPNVDRAYDSGNIVIYQVGALSGVAPVK